MQLCTVVLPLVSTYFLTAQLEPNETLTFGALWAPRVVSVAAPTAAWTPGCVTGRQVAPEPV